MTRSVRLLVAILVPVVLLVACGSTAVLDQDKLRELIETAVESATGVVPTDTSCPDVEDPNDGTTFECTTMLDGQTLRMSGVVTDAEDGSVEVANADAMIMIDQLETAISADFTEQFGFDVAADCGGGVVRVEQPGATFTCTATADGEEAEVLVEVLDVEGNVSYELT